MATASQIKALIRCHMEDDDARFLVIVKQIAAHAVRSGHNNLAQEIRSLVDRNDIKKAKSPKRERLVQQSGALAGLLTASCPDVRLSEMKVSDSLQRNLDRVIHEQNHSEMLISHGLGPLRKLLLVGPPGTGKTMTAAMLSQVLDLALFTVRLDGLITKYMGETASKLRLVFDEIEKTKGVYLFDEFDAIGGKRGAGNDVGEIRRVLNSFLLLLEQDKSESLIVCATNYVGLLDYALFRRFDVVFEYELPSKDVALEVMTSRLAPFDSSNIDWTVAIEAVEGLSHADLTRACEQAAKDVLMDAKTIIETKDLVSALNEQHANLGAVS